MTGAASELLSLYSKLAGTCNHSAKFEEHRTWIMALSEFEIAIGGITSIPVVGGLIFLGFKSFGEKSLDTSKLKPKKKPVVKKETPTSEVKKEKPATEVKKETPATEVKKEPPASEEKISTTKIEDSEISNNPSGSTKEDASPSEQPTVVSEKASTPGKKPPEDKSKASEPNQKT